jgi:hypothetical protein
LHGREDFVSTGDEDFDIRLKRLFPDPAQRKAVRVVFFDLRSDQKEELLAGSDENFHDVLVAKLEEKQAATVQGKAQ